MAYSKLDSNGSYLPVKATGKYCEDNNAGFVGTSTIFATVGDFSLQTVGFYRDLCSMYPCLAISNPRHIKNSSTLSNGGFPKKDPHCIVCIYLRYLSRTITQVRHHLRCRPNRTSSLWLRPKLAYLLKLYIISPSCISNSVSWQRNK